MPHIARLDQKRNPIWPICEDRFSSQLLVILVVCGDVSQIRNREAHNIVLRGAETYQDEYC
jgi:hypothetical protein